MQKQLNIQRVISWNYPLSERCASNSTILYLFDQTKTEKGISRWHPSEKKGGERERAHVAYEHKQREEDKSLAQYIMRQRWAQYFLALKQDQKTRHSTVGMRVEKINSRALGSLPFSSCYLWRDATATTRPAAFLTRIPLVERARAQRGKINEFYSRAVKFRVYPAADPRHSCGPYDDSCSVIKTHSVNDYALHDLVARRCSDALFFYHYPAVPYVIIGRNWKLERIRISTTVSHSISNSVKFF